MSKARPRFYSAAVIYMAFIAGVFFLQLAPVAWAETDSIEVMHLKLGEAATAVQSQLSPEGRVAKIPSRRMLVIIDDAGNIEKARELLSRLDVAPTQLAIQVVLSEQSESDSSHIQISQIVLPGGWVRLAATADSRQGNQQRNFIFRTSSGVAGHLEVGEIRAVGQSVQQYLTARGIVSESRVELLHVTGGFDVQATLLGGKAVRLSIYPWLRKVADKDGRIKVAEAATELVVNLDESVSLAASRSEAKEFATILFGIDALNSQDQLNISVRVSQAGR